MTISSAMQFPTDSRAKAQVAGPAQEEVRQEARQEARQEVLGVLKAEKPKLAKELQLEDPMIDEPESPPLTAAQADTLRGSLKLVSPWRLVAIQAAVGLLAAAVVGWLGQAGPNASVLAMSVLYGSGVVVVPGAMLAWGLRRRSAAVSGAQRAVSFMFWELVKIVLSVALLLLAPRVVEGLNWLALLAGMILSMKVYGLALLWRRQ